jgi:mannose-6-phosphate isomerase-like protein (cupin superfamily)
LEIIVKILKQRYTGNVNTEDVFRTEYIHMWHIKSDKERPDLDPKYHSHPENEVFFCFCGNVEFVVEGYRYTLLPESLLLIPQAVFHGWKTLGPGMFHRLSFHFLPEFLDKTENRPCF